MRRVDVDTESSAVAAATVRACRPSAARQPLLHLPRNHPHRLFVRKRIDRLPSPVLYRRRREQCTRVRRDRPVGAAAVSAPTAVRTRSQRGDVVRGVSVARPGSPQGMRQGGTSRQHSPFSSFPLARSDCDSDGRVETDIRTPIRIHTQCGNAEGRRAVGRSRGPGATLDRPAGRWVEFIKCAGSRRRAQRLRTPRFAATARSTGVGCSCTPPGERTESNRR